MKLWRQNICEDCVQNFNIFCVVLGLSCRKLPKAKEAFWLLVRRKKANSIENVPTVSYPLRFGLHHFYLTWRVKIGKLHLTSRVKIDYNMCMLRNILCFVLRIGLIAALWALIWRFVEPRTQLMRILRAALLLVCLLVMLAVLRITGQ